MALAMKMALEKALKDKPLSGLKSADPKPLVGLEKEGRTLKLPDASVSKPEALPEGKKKPKPPEKKSHQQIKIRFRAPPSQPRYRHLPDYPLYQSAPPQKIKEEVLLKLIGQPEIAWQPAAVMADPLLNVDTVQGIKTSIANKSKLVDRELVIGVDFGTSSTKVVISDRTLKKAYAVPFSDGPGVLAYLWPSLLIEKNGYYSLEGDGDRLNDLKLSLMAFPSDPVRCARVTAYLALIIQYARAWLFQNYKEQYTGTEILWCLALGQPADQSTSKASQSLFKDLGHVAWSLSTMAAPLSVDNVLSEWSKRDGEQSETEEFQCVVMPELAAQIHGYVSSDSFDPRRPNIFLMVDVGAGTVDASIFRVIKDEMGTTSFTMFSNVVESYGVANLHRHRVDWWRDQLAKFPVGAECTTHLRKMRLPTEYRGFFPFSFVEYVKNVELKFSGGARTPDELFFNLINQQLVGDVFGDAKRKKMLGHKDIEGMPYFLCGGGSQHGFYAQLHAALKSPATARWLSLVEQTLLRPQNLVAEGLPRGDYHRMSVAFGLSQLNLGSIKKAPPMTRTASTKHRSNWTSNYIDKDAC